MDKKYTHGGAPNQSPDPMASDFLLSTRVIFEQFSYDVTTNVVDQLHFLALKGRPSDRRLFSAMENLCFDTIADDPAILGPKCADILLNSVCQYYELVGLFSAALNGQLRVLSFSISIKSLALQRRAHNCLGASYVRFCDFRKACEHLEKACRVALQLDNHLYVFASLCNTVALFKSMGLLEPAKNLSLKLIDHLGDGQNYNYIHLVNANNGLSVSLTLGDLDSAQKFYDVGKDRIEKCGDLLTELNVAYFESASIVFMSMQGNINAALSCGTKCLTRIKESSSIRVKILISCAIAEVRLALNDQSAILESREILEKFLEAAQHIPTHYEEILRLLVRLYTASLEADSEKNAEKIINYLRRLREYLVGTKHRVFFEDQLKDLNEAVDESLVLMNPCYRLPSWLTHVQHKSVSTLPDIAQEEFVQASEIDLIPSSIAKFVGSEIELRFRSPDYDAAENWAVAADIALGSDGNHGFRVGRLSSALATKLGFSPNDAMQVELASRLHNIGHITMFVRPKATYSWRERGTFSSFCQHVNTGRKILEQFNCRTLKLGSIIAGSHHEWWNGGGYPLGAKRDAIPLEGRLCMIADTFIRLLKPELGKNPFSLTQARDQVVAMSGVQLDPKLVQLLLEFLDDNAEIDACGRSLKSVKGGSMQLIERRDGIRGVLELTT